MAGIHRRQFLAAQAAALAAATIAPQRVDAQGRGPTMTRVRTGAELLVGSGLAALAGKRVGLVTNHTARVGTEHLADLVRQAPGVTLAAILVPEHGFRGEAEAGAAVRSSLDARTGVPVLSLYGTNRKPTPQMLKGVDILVYDIQDIGVRYYTYISTMGLAMQAAAEAQLPFVVLDRPNPLGGEDVAGFVLEDAQRSFVGQFRIPMVHGLTAAELAALIRAEPLMPGLQGLDLRVMKMEGWSRGMRWPATGLPWLGTSPNIVSFETALVYAGVGLLEGTAASDGRGTTTPFTLVGAPWLDAGSIASELGGAGLPGVRFEAATFTPKPIKGMASSPKHAGRALPGVRIRVIDAASYRPAQTGVHVLSAFHRTAAARGEASFFTPADFFDKLAGTRRLRTMLLNGVAPADIIAAWSGEVDRFRATRARHLLY